MTARGVRVCFANIPYISCRYDPLQVRQNEAHVQEQLASLGPFLEHREQVIFAGKYFFNTSLHLNVQGRRIRTNLLLSGIRDLLRMGSAQPSHE